jgi:hypothetical protein
VTTTGQGGAIGGDLGPLDHTEFLAKMEEHMPQARLGPASPPPGEGLIAEPLVFKYKCGAATRSLKVKANGLVMLTDETKGITNILDMTAAWAADVSYIRLTHAGLLAKLCFGAPAGKLEISFLGDKYTLEQPLATIEQLEAALVGIKSAIFMRAPAQPKEVLVGTLGTLTLASDFIDVTVVKPSCHEMFATRETTSVRTSDVTYFTASLPSWQNALIVAIRDIQLFKMSASISKLCGSSLVLLPVWPCDFFSELHITIMLFINAIVSITKFLIIFFFRKTSLIIGGPGPAKQVAFLPIDEPVTLLRSMAVKVAALQAKAADELRDTSAGAAKLVIYNEAA